MAVTLYVRKDGSDANDGSADDAGHAFLTIGKGGVAARAIGNDDVTVYVDDGDYFDEGEVNVFIGVDSGYTLTIIGTGIGNIEVRQSEAYTFSQYALYAVENGDTVIEGMFINNQLYGDGSANTTGYVFRHGGTGNFKLQQAEINGRAAMFYTGLVPSGGSFTADRCYIHDGAGYILQLTDGDFTLTANFIKDVVGLAICASIRSIATATIKNNTLIDTYLGSPTFTTIYENVVCENNLLYGSNTQITFEGITTSHSIVNNLQYDPNFPEPRTASAYKRVAIDGAGTSGDEHQTSLCFDPDFDVTEPALLSTSFCIGRGKDASVTDAFVLFGGGAATFNNASLPMIGCFAPTSGSKQVITPVAKKVMIIGDSWVYGTGASLPADRFTDILETLLPAHTFVKMPGDTDRHLGIHGASSATGHFIAQEFAVLESPETVAVLIGVNDLNGVQTLTSLINQLKETLDVLFDYGVVNVVYIGTQVEDADSVTPDVTDANTTETTIAAHCATNGYQAIKISEVIQAQSGWNSDSVPPGLYGPDDLHLNNDGHSFIASEIDSYLIYSPGGGSNTVELAAVELVTVELAAVELVDVLSL